MFVFGGYRITTSLEPNSLATDSTAMLYSKLRGTFTMYPTGIRSKHKDFIRSRVDVVMMKLHCYFR